MALDMRERRLCSLGSGDGGARAAGDAHWHVWLWGLFLDAHTWSVNLGVFPAALLRRAFYFVFAYVPIEQRIVNMVCKS
jgi:hypothetical protein